MYEWMNEWEAYDVLEIMFWQLYDIFIFKPQKDKGQALKICLKKNIKKPCSNAGR